MLYWMSQGVFKERKIHVSSIVATMTAVHLSRCSSLLEVRSVPNRVGQQLGNYRLLRLLGRGGFAEVYLGEHVYLKRRAAGKGLHTSLDDRKVDRVLADGPPAARLNRTPILPVVGLALAHCTPIA